MHTTTAAVVGLYVLVKLAAELAATKIYADPHSTCAERLFLLDYIQDLSAEFLEFNLGTMTSAFIVGR